MGVKVLIDKRQTFLRAALFDGDQDESLNVQVEIEFKYHPIFAQEQIEIVEVLTEIR